MPRLLKYHKRGFKILVPKEYNQRITTRYINAYEQSVIEPKETTDQC